jgi:DNA mismatch endonuclease Vsr
MRAERDGESARGVGRVAMTGKSCNGLLIRDEVYSLPSMANLTSGKIPSLSTLESSSNIRKVLFKIPVALLNGWRRNQAIFGHPDFVFSKQKVVVFVDGDFWHGHSRLGRIPKSNTAFWKAKINANKARDRKVNRVLKKAGWNVIRIWESEIEKPSMRRKLQAVKEHLT